MVVVGVAKKHVEVNRIDFVKSQVGEVGVGGLMALGD